jgi:hypothetical protein
LKINDDINLVIPVKSDSKGVVVYAYHTPISRAVFESNYRILAATKSALAGKGIHYQMDSGPRIAALTLVDEGKKDALERGDFDENGQPKDSGAQSLLMEIRRLTTALIPGNNGWDMVPVGTAITKGAIDEDDWREAESAIVFFTCHYALAKKAERLGMAQATASLLKGSSTSSSLSEFAASLQTSTTEQPLLKKVASSVPL